MAVTGVILIGFVVLHMVGDLKFFFGEKHFDEYAHFLRRIGDPVLPKYYFLRIQRTFLVGAVLLHIWAATSLTLQSKRARPEPYVHTDNIQATYASRTMRWGGVIILLFIVFHLLDIATGTAHAGSYVKGHVYDNSVSGFEHPAVTIAYTVAMGALGMHLYHGFGSIFQTLGRNNARLRAKLRTVSALLSVVVVVGFLSVPYAILFGVRP